MSAVHVVNCTYHLVTLSSQTSIFWDRHINTGLNKPNPHLASLFTILGPGWEHNDPDRTFHDYKDIFGRL